MCVNHAQFADWLEKPSDVGEKGDDDADSDLPSHHGQCSEPEDDRRGEHADEFHDGRKGAGKRLRPKVRPEIAAVDLIEARLAHLFAGERLHHTYARNIFLKAGCHLANGLSGAQERFSGTVRIDERRDHHDREHGEGVERKFRAHR